jgi:hypothetical protein
VNSEIVIDIMTADIFPVLQNNGRGLMQVFRTVVVHIHHVLKRHVSLMFIEMQIAVFSIQVL